jgi:calcineurin-like phosphoesterase family protein
MFLGLIWQQNTKNSWRVTKVGGMIILCPGNNDTDNDTHSFLVINQGFMWSRFEEPRDGWKRKYWQRIVQSNSS